MKIIYVLRFVAVCLLLNVAAGCSKSSDDPPPPVVIPEKINGVIKEITMMPVDINTPDKATLLINMNDVLYKVQFNAVDQAQANAELFFANDTILSDESREFANLGQNDIAYAPLKPNELLIDFIGSTKEVFGTFNALTSFGGTFGAALIAEWREPNDPSKPTLKAKNDIINFVKRYADADGPGGSSNPVYLSVQITKQ